MIVINENAEEEDSLQQRQSVSYRTMVDRPKAESQEEIVFEEIVDPQNRTEVREHSWKGMLAHSIGREILVTFLIGTQNPVTVKGRLDEVGNDFISLYQRERNSYISGDIYSIKFAEMYGAAEDGEENRDEEQP